MSNFIYNTTRLMMRCYPFHIGQGRIIDRTFLRRFRHDSDTITVKTSDGFPITVFPNELIGRHIYLTGQFDRTIVEVLLSYAREDDRILDIGANIGYVSCVLLKRLAHCHVVAVEPLSKCYKTLDANVRQFGENRAQAVNVAISDQSGVGMMNVCPNNLGASKLQLNSASTSETETNNQAEKAMVWTASDLIQNCNLDRVDLIKIDVEGHEEQVLVSLLTIE